MFPSQNLVDSEFHMYLINTIEKDKVKIIFLLLII